MTTQTMLEKIARAIRKDWTDVEWGQPSEGPRMDHEDAFCVARAALQALREPTDGVVSALDMEILTEGVSGEDCRRAFVAAIDAILQEKA